jgi:hypothetical protein
MAMFLPREACGQCPRLGKPDAEQNQPSGMTRAAAQEAGGRMAGRVKHLIDELISLRAAGNQGVEHFMRAHLMLNGIDPARYTESSPDDVKKERCLEQMINAFSRQKGAT